MSPIALVEGEGKIQTSLERVGIRQVIMPKTHHWHDVCNACGTPMIIMGYRTLDQNCSFYETYIPSYYFFIRSDTVKSFDLRRITLHWQLNYRWKLEFVFISVSKWLSILFICKNWIYNVPHVHHHKVKSLIFLGAIMYLKKDEGSQVILPKGNHSQRKRISE